MKKFFLKIKLWFKKRELKCVVEHAIRASKVTGRKVWIVEVDGELKAMYKVDFKNMWNNTRSFKKHTVQQWEKRSDMYYQCYHDLKPENKFINSN